MIEKFFPSSLPKATLIIYQIRKTTNKLLTIYNYVYTIYTEYSPGAIKKKYIKLYIFI